VTVPAELLARYLAKILVLLSVFLEMILITHTCSSIPHCTEKLSCSVAAELLPTQTSKSEGSTVHSFFAALQ
jgi:hypothetical protein